MHISTYRLRGHESQLAYALSSLLDMILIRLEKHEISNMPLDRPNKCNY